MKKSTQPTAWIRTISTGVFVALFAMVLLTLVMPTQAKAVCDVHSWGDWRTVQQPTCTAKGTEQRTCPNCGTSEYRDIPATGHSWGTTRVTLEPTCTMAGKGNHSCQVCKKRESCNIKPLGHDWVTVENTPGTCIRRARTVKQCSRCGEQDITEGAYGTHVWGAWQTITEPTCTAQGMKMRNCTVCPTASDRESIPALGHNMVTVATHPATCMNRGYTELKCTRCDYTDTNEGSYGSHVMGEWQTTTQPTCTAAGEKRRTCTVCGKAPEKKTIPALGHDMVAGETVTGTCIREGYTSKKCSRCGHEEKTSTGYGAHVMGKWKTTTQPTCTAAGEKQRNCTVCGKAPEKKTIPALGHDMVTGETVTGTCIREGYTSKKCSRCGHKEKTSTGYGSHVWGEWEITIPATCTTEGEHRHTCVVCQVAAEVLEYPALGHNMVPGETVTGTCIREGYTSKKCSRCGHKEKTSTGYGAHVMGEWQTTTQPTCTAAGEKQRNCTVCGKAPEKETIPANGHRWGAWKEKVAPQVGKEGLEERKCRVCGKTETRPIPALAEAPAEPKPKLTIEAWPDHYDEDNMYVGYKVTNTGNVPVQVFVFVAFMPDNVDTRMGTGALLAGDYGTSRYAIVNPGETVTTDLPKGPIEIQDDERTQGYADFQVDCIGKTESGTVIRSNRADVHFDFDTVPESEETETEPKLVLVKDSSEPSEGSPVHMRQVSSYFIRGQATVRWRVINASNEAIWFKWTVGRYPYRGSSMSKNKYHGMTLLPGETSEPFTMLYYFNHPTPACPIKGEMSVIENGGEYSTWFSLVCYGVTKSGEEVTSNTVTFNWPVFFDEDPDDSTNDPTIDPEDPTHDPEDPNDPQNMAASLTVVKAEASAPANGQHYAAGEEITFSITYQNVGDKPISSIHVYDALAGFGEIGSTGSLAPSESRTCSFKYRVTAADVNVYGYVANTAFATYQDGGLTRKATSNRVVIILNPDIVPPGILDPENPDDPDNPGLIPTITIGDPEHPFDPEHPEEYDGPYGLPGMQGEDHCELIVKNHATGTTDYDQHSCAAHQSTRTAVQAMTGAAATPAVSLSAWTYARTLWQNDCNVLLEKLYSCANGPAKAIIMEENLAFETMVTMREAALNVLYPDQPEKVAEEIAKLYEDRCTELCYMLHTLPKAKPVEAASTEMFMMSGDGTICRTEITGDTGADVSYTETLCSQHGMTDMMTGFVLNGTDDLATATKQIGQLWRSELRTEMDIIRGALSDENAAIITYDLGTTRIWLEAHEALLQMLYPKQEAAVTNIINDTIKQRVTTLCEEVNK